MNYLSAPKTSWWRLWWACPRRLDRQLRHRKKKFYYMGIMRELLSAVKEMRDTDAIMANFSRYVNASMGYRAHGGKVDQATITSRMANEVKENG